MFFQKENSFFTYQRVIQKLPITQSLQVRLPDGHRFILQYHVSLRLLIVVVIRDDNRLRNAHSWPNSVFRQSWPGDVFGAQLHGKVDRMVGECRTERCFENSRKSESEKKKKKKKRKREKKKKKKKYVSSSEDDSDGKCFFFLQYIFFFQK